MKNQEIHNNFKKFISPVLQRLGLADRELAADVAVLDMGLSCGEPAKDKRSNQNRKSNTPTGGWILLTETSLLVATHPSRK